MNTTPEQIHSNLFQRAHKALFWDPTSPIPYIEPHSRPTKPPKPEETAQKEENLDPNPKSYTPLPIPPPLPEPIQYARPKDIAQAFDNMNESFLMGVEYSTQANLQALHYYLDRGQVYKNNLHKYRKESEEEEAAQTKRTDIEKYASTTLGVVQAAKGLEIIVDGIGTQNPAKIVSGAAMCLGGGANAATELLLDKNSTVKPFVQAAGVITSIFGAIMNADTLLASGLNTISSITQVTSSTTNNYYQVKALDHRAAQERLTAERTNLEYEQMRSMEQQKKFLGTMKSSNDAKTLTAFSDSIDSLNEIIEEFLRKRG